MASTTLTFPLLKKCLLQLILFKVTINYFFLRISRVILELAKYLPPRPDDVLSIELLQTSLHATLCWFIN